MIKAATAPLAALLLLGLAACGSSGPAYFVASSSSQVLLVEWQAPQDGQASGTVTEVQPSGSAPDQTVGVTNVPVDVAISGSQVTLRPTGLYELFGGTSISATLGDGGLTITTPPDSTTGTISTGTLASSTQAAYNADVATLRHHISFANAEAIANQQYQAQQSANTAAEQQASSDLATLSNDTHFGGDLHALASDVGQTNSDLAGERKDAIGGPNADGGGCYNIEDNVDYDATDNVEYDATDNLGYDLQDNLQPDISTVRGDIGTLRGDLRSLSASGLPATQGAAGVISTARAAISHAITIANGDISVVNADVDQAYAIARGMATGSCAGDGPGGTPAPIRPIS
ncbi:MAG: hypothetical protein ACRDRJ_00685 [Streptosporangiaceae bacterium]